MSNELVFDSKQDGFKNKQEVLGKRREMYYFLNSRNPFCAPYNTFTRPALPAVGS